MVAVIEMIPDPLAAQKLRDGVPMVKKQAETCVVRMRPEASAIYKFWLRSMVIALGVVSAAVAGPPSPLNQIGRAHV